MLYLLWFNFILGLNFISLCFKLSIIHYHTPKQGEIKFKPRIKLNHNIFTVKYSAFFFCSSSFQRLEKCHGILSSVISNLSENEAHDALNQMVSRHVICILFTNGATPGLSLLLNPTKIIKSQS